jgi:hypothetical protein
VNWLLWREYRRNRWVLVVGAVSVLLACLLDFNLALDKDGLIAPDGFLVLLLSVLTISILAGNSIASERAARSAAFIADLPRLRSKTLVSKLFLPLAVVVVLCAVDLLRLTRQMELQPVEKRIEGFFVFGLVTSVALLICGASWLVSALQSSPALATICGVFTAGLSAAIGAEAITSGQTAWWFAMNSMVAAACFYAGSRYYLRCGKTSESPLRTAT